MNKLFNFSLIFSMLFLSCNNKKSDAESTVPNINASAHDIESQNEANGSDISTSLLLEKDSILNKITKVDDWSINDFIVSCPKRHLNELKQEINRERLFWKDVTNPFLATYIGNDFGDYHHIDFEDSDKKRFDFGRGKNDFGIYQLFYDDEQMSDNPKYLNKEFKIIWEWKSSKFPCCSGDYETIEAYKPSIIGLELVENNTRLNGLSILHPNVEAAEWRLNNYTDQFISIPVAGSIMKLENLIEKRFDFRTKSSNVFLTLIFCKNQQDALSVAEANSVFNNEKNEAGVNGALLFIVQGSDHSKVNDILAWFAGNE